MFKKKCFPIVISLILILSILFPIISIQVKAAEPVNLLTNGGFEEIANAVAAPDLERYWPEGQPNNWSYNGANDTVIPKRDEFVAVYDTTDYKEGDQSLKVELTDAARYLQNKNNPILPNTNYILSFWYKTSNLSSTASGANAFLVRAERTKADGSGASTTTRTDSQIPAGTADWTYKEIPFLSDANARLCNIVVQIANHTTNTWKSSGTIWFDDFKLIVAPVGVSSITLNETTKTLNVNDEFMLTPAILPANATDKSVNWNSTNPNIAAVDSNGTVKAIGIGNCSITATSVSTPSKSGSCEITVEALSQTDVTNIILSDTNRTIEVGDGYILTPTLLPGNASDKGIAWSSSDENIAKVNVITGAITAVAVGNCTITAASVSTPAVSKDCTITVIDQFIPTDTLYLDGGFEKQKPISDVANTNAMWPEGEAKDFVPVNEPSMTFKSGFNKYDTGFKAAFDKITKKSGDRSIKVEITNATGWFQAFKEVLPNRTYTVSFWYKTGTASPITLIRHEQYSSLEPATANLISATRANLVSPAPANRDWTQVTKIFKTDRAAKTHAFAIQLGTAATNGTFWLDDIRLAYTPIYVDSVTITPPASTDIAVKSDLQLTATFLPSNADDGSVIWSSSNTGVATVDEYGRVTGKSVGSVTITATSVMNADKKDIIALTVLSAPSATGISLNKAAAALDRNRGERLVATVLPENTADVVTWTSTNPAVAKVIDGMVVAKGTGSATITATVNGLSSSCAVTVVEPTLDDFDKLRIKWRELIIPYAYDVSEAGTQESINKIAEQANYYWENMNRSALTTPNVFLWTKEDLTITGTGNEQEFTHFHDYLRIMSMAFVAEGSPLQYNPDLYSDIVQGMDWINTNFFTGQGGTSSSKWTVSNWWHKNIGMPVAANDIVTLMYDFLPQAKINEYVTRIGIYANDPQVNVVSGGNTTQANRVDKCKATMVYGILSKDVTKLTLAATTLFAGTPDADVMAAVKTSGNGFYYDGSYIEHTNYPYTTSYGMVALGGIAQIMYMLASEDVNGTTFTFNSAAVSRMYDYIDTAYIPLLYKGLGMDNTSGRSISRYAVSDLTRGADIVKAIFLISDSAPSPYKERYMGYIKTWVKSNSKVGNSDNLFMKKKYKALLSEAGIGEIQEPNGVYTMNRMARTIYKTDDFTYAIAMNNYRISPYENINGENPLANHTADGMTYLYNDMWQFNGNYWATVDYKRLPGTTVDTYGIDNIKTQATGLNDAQRWAGGSKLDEFGTTGFSIHMNNRMTMDLKANKSWFMLGKKVIALGSGITSSTGRNVETIIENRKLNPSGSNVFTVNGANITSGHGSTILADWAYIGGSNDSNGIGYYFPEGQNITAGKVTEVGNWSNVNSASNPLGNVTDVYAQMVVNHGINPTNDKYQYVLLPGKSSAEVQSYAVNPDFTILAHTDTLHAVIDHDLNITAINNYDTSPQTAGGITVSTTASVMVREYDDNTMKVAVMEPTAITNNARYVSVTIDKPGKGLVSKDSNVTVVQTTPNIILTFDTQGGVAAGKLQNTWYATLEIEPVPIVTNVSADPSTLTNSGGNVNVTITGRNLGLAASLELELDNTRHSVSVNSAASARGVINMPGNRTQDDATYTIKVFLDGIDTGQSAMVVVKKAADSNDNGSNNNGNNSSNGSGTNVNSSYSSEDSGAVSNGVPNREASGLAVNGKNVAFELVKIDTVNSNAAIEAATVDNKAWVTIPSDTLSTLRDKGIKHLEIKTAFASYFIPNHLESLLSGYNSSASDMSFRITLTDQSNNKDVLAVIKASLARANVLGPIVDFKVEVIDSSTGKIVGEVKEFGETITRYIVLPKDFKNSSEYYGAFRYNEATAGLSFIPHKIVSVGGDTCVAIRSKTNSMYVVSENNISFSDVKEGEWYTTFIKTAAANKLVSGVGNGFFIPEKNVTRAEFVQMIAATIQLPELKTDITEYGDVHKDAWYYDAVMRLKSAGLLNKFTDHNFNPNTPMTREEMVSISAAAVRHEKIPAISQYIDLSTIFSDYSEFDKNNVTDLELIYKLKIMVGVGDKFEPKGLTTRAQAVTVQINLLKSLDLID